MLIYRSLSQNEGFLNEVISKFVIRNPNMTDLEIKKFLIKNFVPHSVILTVNLLKITCSGQVTHYSGSVSALGGPQSI